MWGRGPLCVGAFDLRRCRPKGGGLSTRFYGIYILIPTGSKDPAEWAYYENYPSSSTRVAGYEKFTGMKDLDYALTSPESNCATYVDGYKSLLDKPCTSMDSYSLHGRLCEFVFSE